MRKLFLWLICAAASVPLVYQPVLAEVGGDAAKAEQAGNLLSHTFEDLGSDGLPSDWGFQVRGENPGSASVSVVKEEAGNVVVARMPEEASIWLELPERPEEGSWPRLSLDAEKDYMLVLELKVEDMFYTGSWFRRPAAINFGVYGTAGKHVWMAVHGEGDTDGWVTAVLPFPPEEDRSNYERYRVLIRCNNMTGTVYFRNPMIIERPSLLGDDRFFEREDGSIVKGNQLQLRR